MLFTTISIIFVVLVVIVIFAYRNMYLKKKGRERQDETQIHSDNP